ncbi:CPBP family glutamic-type intramembrane protease [Pyrodictium delaneyi]|nr:CPBP family glutamic-type intramembrane protease [Pyrodictium delaneyi]
MYTPMLGVVAAVVLGGRDAVGYIRRLLRADNVVLVWYLLGPLLVYAALGIYMALLRLLGMGGIGFDRRLRRPVNSLLDGAPGTSLALLVLVYAAGATVSVLAALGEEFLWRGLLLRELSGWGLLATLWWVLSGACGMSRQYSLWAMVAGSG